MYTVQERAKFYTAQTYYELLNYHRWQRLNTLIITKAVNGLPITEAEVTHTAEVLWATVAANELKVY